MSKWNHRNLWSCWRPEVLEIALILFWIGAFPVTGYAETLTYVSTIISYELEGRQEPPETAMIELTDEVTGAEFEREVSCMEIREREVLWQDGFSFPITVTGYDAEQFKLGNTVIPSDAELSAYGEEFLSYLGLPVDCYTIDTVEWAGESYEENGVVCRDAVARGRKLVRHVDVKYGGQVMIPDSQEMLDEAGNEEDVAEQELTGEEEKVKASDANSMMVDNKNGSGEEVGKEKASGENGGDKRESREGPIEKIRHYIKEHITVVTLGSTFFMGILGSVILLWTSGKTEKKSGKQREKPD